MKDRYYTDEEILAALRGDVRSRRTIIAWIYDQPGFRNPAFGLVRRSGGSEEEAEEVFQDGIIILEKNIRKGKYDGSAPVKQYFLGICRYLWYGKVRKEKKLQTEELSGRSDIPGDANPEASLLSAEQRAAIRELLDLLGEPCRTVLRMWASSYTMQEIAETLDYTEAYAKQKKFRCWKQLLKLLDENPGLTQQLKG